VSGLKGLIRSIHLLSDIKRFQNDHFYCCISVSSIAQIYFFSAKHQDKEWLIVEKEKFDNEFDKDKDGKLNGAEILSWVVPSNE
jgi:hypothetical protein